MNAFEEQLAKHSVFVNKTLCKTISGQQLCKQSDFRNVTLRLLFFPITWPTDQTNKTGREKQLAYIFKYSGVYM